MDKNTIKLAIWSGCYEAATIDLIPCEKFSENLSLMSIRVRVIASILMVIIV